MLKLKIIKVHTTAILLIIIILSYISCSDAKESVNEVPVKEIELTENTGDTKELYVDLGTISKKDANVQKDFLLINKTKESIILYYAVTNCGCTIAVFEDEEGNTSDEYGKTYDETADIELNPGESITAHVNMDLSEEVLGDSYKILKVYNDYDEVILLIEMSYRIVE